MSLRVGVQIQICQMDGTEIINVTHVDTAINPNPVDPTVESILAASMAERMTEETIAEVQERLNEYNQALARLLQGG